MCVLGSSAVASRLRASVDDGLLEVLGGDEEIPDEDGKVGGGRGGGRLLLEVAGEGEDGLGRRGNLVELLNESIGAK